MHSSALWPSAAVCLACFDNRWQDEELIRAVWCHSKAEFRLNAVKCKGQPVILQHETEQTNSIMHLHQQVGYSQFPPGMSLRTQWSDTLRHYYYLIYMQPPYTHRFSVVLLWHHHHVLDVHYVMVTFSVTSSQRSWLNYFIVPPRCLPAFVFEGRVWVLWGSLLHVCNRGKFLCKCKWEQLISDHTFSPLRNATCSAGGTMGSALSSKAAAPWLHAGGK